MFLPKKISSFQAWTLCILALTAILYWRRPDAFYNPQLWAEDGPIFLSQAQLQGWYSIFTPYAGYYHLLARIVAWLGHFWPTQYTPPWYSLASWLLLVALVTYIFSPRFPFSPTLKFWLGLTLVAIPVDNEVFFSIATWPFILSAVWCLLAIAPPATARRQAWGDVGVLILAGLSTPFVLCLWPLFVFRWLKHRTPNNLLLLGISLTIVLIQTLNTAARLQVGGVWPTFEPLFLQAFAYRFSFLFLGDLVQPLFTLTGAAGAALFFLLAFYAYFLHHAWVTQNQPVLLLLVACATAITLSFYVLRHLPQTFLATPGRHFYLPALLITWALLLAQPAKPWARWVPLTFIGLAFLLFTPRFKNEVRPDLHWVTEVAHCRKRPCRIPINPVWDPPAWFVDLYDHYYILPADFTPLSASFTVSPPAITSTTTIALLGYTATQTATTYTLEFAWQAPQPAQGDYTYIVILYPPTNDTRVSVYEDKVQLRTLYPIAQWQPNEVVVGQVQIPLNTLSSGHYRVAVGWYLAPAWTRLTLQSQPGQSQINNHLLLPQELVVP